MCLSTAQETMSIANAEVTFLFVNNKVAGSIAGFSSSSKINVDQLENATLKGSVAVETIDTGNSIRNWSLKRSKYFDADTYPNITFESNSISITDENTTVKGLLTIKKTTKEVTFNFVKSGAKLIGTTSLYSSDYGINIKSDRKKNKVDVKIILHLK